MKPILEVKNLTMNFGGLRALDSLSLEVCEGEIVALIGPNGAGKTTFFNCITGIHHPTTGDMLILPPGKKQKRLNGLKPNHVTEKGLARTFQNIRLFPNMTVLENVMIGRHCRMSAGIAGAIFRGPSTINEEKKVVETATVFSKKSVLPTSSTNSPRTCLTALRDASKSQEPWQPIPFCSFLTNRLRE